MMRLQAYDVNLVCKKVTDMHIADTLSRAFLPESTSSYDVPEEFEVLSVLPISSTRQDELRKAIAEDEICKKLITYIQTGWPSDAKKIPKAIRWYSAVQHELAYENGLIMKSTRALIPKHLRNYYLQQPHKGHSGVESTKRRAREIVFWPTINSDI